MPDSDSRELRHLCAVELLHLLEITRDLLKLLNVLTVLGDTADLLNLSGENDTSRLFNSIEVLLRNVVAVTRKRGRAVVERVNKRAKLSIVGNGVGIVDNLGNYLSLGSGNYCQAYLIRNEEIIDDTHQLDDINNELLKGVYM